MNQSLSQSSAFRGVADSHASKIRPPVNEPGSKKRTGAPQLSYRKAKVKHAVALRKAFTEKQPVHAAVLQMVSVGRLQAVSQESIEAAQAAFFMFKSGFDAGSVRTDR
ncbi:hypothetical protein [Paraburkholderia ginsengisoli]|uniref:Uncharacterized protein n=1 Tax=Paraburkholderia ginsengisoli TaxID=311231 RepID=A0A7T4N9R3_9BURK|nr:hypothetical protein [Paraburkholderia ginsengisoli]QQC67844.1 hypothetical protein I6I06_28920 [Paraburkholderia ginsengisoli]